MVELTIDGKQVKVPKGHTILQAAREAGITIPTLCYDPRLKPFGACRLCLVEVEAMKGRLIPSCSTPATDGMVVKTSTEAVDRARKMVLELLLIHHPLDCPVCDKAGECKLQDLVFKYGAASNRFMYGQVKFHDTIEKASHLVERDTNRCVLCGCCVRVCDEIQSVGEISFVNRGFPSKIGTAFDLPMSCEFCGQCIAICPVGALNSKLFKHRVRAWELENTVSVCGYCGVGCRVELQHRKDRLYRVKAEVGKGVNNGNLCGKGRFGWEYIHREDRITKPRISKNGGQVEVGWGEALDFLAGKLNELKQAGKSQAIGGAITSRATNEDAYLFGKLFREILGSSNVDSEAGHSTGVALRVLSDALGAGGSTACYDDIDQAEAILMVNSSTQESNPVIGNRIIRRKRTDEDNIVRLISVHPRRMKMSRFSDHWLGCKPGTAAQVLMGMAHAIHASGKFGKEAVSAFGGFQDFENALTDYAPTAVEAATGVPAAQIEAAAEAYANANSGLIVLSASPFEEEANAAAAAAAANLALLTGNLGKPGCGILVMSEKSNMQGVLDMGIAPDRGPGFAPVGEGKGGMNVNEMIKAAGESELSALYLTGIHPEVNLPGAKGLGARLAKLDLLVVQDLFESEVSRAAHVVLPASAFAEKEGTFTNSERRVQRLSPAVASPGEAKPDWWIFAELASKLGGDWQVKRADDVTAQIVKSVPNYSGIEVPVADGGIQWPVGEDKKGTDRLLAGGLPEGAKGFAAVKPPVIEKSDQYPMLLVAGPVLYHSGSLSTRSDQLREVYPEALVEIAAKDAGALGISDGDSVTLSSAEGEVSCKAQVTKYIVDGAVFLPNHFEGASALSLYSSNNGKGPVAVKVTKI